jgi:glycosyltransferase involved in cell wall biosynthesis
VTPGTIAVIVSGFPRTSETFAVNELTALADRGLLEAVFATKPGDRFDPQPGCRRLLPLVHYLPPGSAAQQGAAVRQHLAGRRVNGIHAYFAHTPAEVAESAAALLRLPFGFSVHARDARKVDAPTLLARARRAACVVACNADVARALADDQTRIHLVPHGVDRTRFRPTAPRVSGESRRLRLLAVGRLVEKKGFDVLVRALARLDDASELRIVGDGPERDRLQRLANATGVNTRVAFVGRCTHHDLPAEYAGADVVVVPSVVDRSGDRDGLPNVVLEAMASARPVVATRVGAIASAVQHGVTGLLVDARSPAALTAALRQLAGHPERRLEMGQRGAEAAARGYDLGRCARHFAESIEAAYA